MPRLAHIITDLNVGGAETMLARLIERTDRERFPAIVISLIEPGPLAGRIRDAGVEVVSLGLRRGLPDPLGLVRLRRILAGQRPDVIHCWMYHAMLAGTLAHGRQGRPALVWNLRCSAMTSAPLLTRLTVSLLARLSTRPALIIANAEAGRRDHERLGFRARQWRIVPNGVDLTVYHPDPAARSHWRANLGIPEAAPLIGMVARVAEMKDHDTFLRAAAACPDPTAHFVAIGKDTPSLHERAARLGCADALAGRLHAIDETPEVPALLAALDVATLTSAFGEGFPNVLTEALATGLPCVATDVGDAAAIVGDCGGIVPPRAPEALAEAWAAVLRLPPAERSALTARALARAERFSIDRTVADYAELHDALATMPHRGAPGRALGYERE